MTHFVWPLIAFAGTTFAAASASADATAVADELFREGKRLLEAGRVADACPKLAASMKTDPALGTLLYLAACHEKLGLTATAFSEFSSATDWARRANRNDRLLFAQKREAALEPKLSTVLIHAAITVGTRVRLDDGEFSSTLIESPLPLDPGEHSIEARAPGHASWRASLTVPPDHASLTVTVPPLIPDSTPVAQADPPETAVAGEDEQAPRAPPTQPVATDSHVLAWSAAGLASASAIVGTVFGVLTFSARDSARSECPSSQCVPGGLDDINRARTYANVSTVAFGAAFAGAFATAYLLVSHGSHSHRDAAAVACRPIIVPDVSLKQAGLSLVGRFE